MTDIHFLVSAILHRPDRGRLLATARHRNDSIALTVDTAGAFRRT